MITTSPFPVARRRGWAAPLSLRDQRILSQVEHYLGAGIDLKSWWERADAEESYREVFPLTSAGGGSHSFGFRDRAPVSGSHLGVIGNVQRMFYDKPKVRLAGHGDGLDGLRAQLSEFALRYFMRTSDFPLPAARPGDRRGGFGYSQLYYKRRDTGEVGKFHHTRSRAIVDLRQLEERYEWIVVRLRIHNFGFTFRPFGSGSPNLSIPLTGTSYLILSRDFILDESQPADESLAGRFGLGYAFLPNLGRGVLAYGPGRFDAAFQLIRFEIHKNGEIWCRMAFVANRPRSIVEVDLNPLSWAARAFGTNGNGRRQARTNGHRKRLPDMSRFDVVSKFIEIANAVTGGAADRRLGMSKEELERLFLSQHFLQHHEAIAGTLTTWRQVGDWRDPRNLPAWASGNGG